MINVFFLLLMFFPHLAIHESMTVPHHHNMLHRQPSSLGYVSRKPKP